MRRILVTVVLGAISASAYSNAHEIVSNEELRALIKIDQAERNGVVVDWKVIDKNDRIRRASVVKMLQNNKIRTAEDFYNAGLIFQHGESEEDIRLALALATISSKLAPQHPAPKWLIAASWDRYMMWKKRPQWYGTQFQISPSTGERALYPIDPDAVSDEERAAFSVPPIPNLKPALPENKAERAN